MLATCCKVCKHFHIVRIWDALLFEGGRCTAESADVHCIKPSVSRSGSGRYKAVMGKVAMDMARRRMFADAEVQRLALKAISMSTRLPRAVRLAAVSQLAEMPRNTSATRIRMRCVETGRPRAVIKEFGLSRLAFRRHASNGRLPYVWKAR